MTTSHTTSGGCFCGAVQLRVQGEPAAMGYCHCESCRHWSASPINAFTLWPLDALTITAGAGGTDAQVRRTRYTCASHNP